MRKLTKEDISDLLSASAASIAVGAAIKTDVIFRSQRAALFPTTAQCPVIGRLGRKVN